MRQEGFEPSTGWVEATCSVQAELLARDRVPRVWRFDSIERQRSALRGLGWSSPAFFKKHAPSLSTLACHLRLVAVPVTLIRRPGEDGDPGRSYTSASRHAVVVEPAPPRYLGAHRA